MADVPGAPRDDAGCMGDDGARGLGSPLYVGPEMSTSEDPGFALPTGTVTFLSTDIEGSTHRFEETPEAMDAALARHGALLEEAIHSHGGVRPVEQGGARSVVAAFGRAVDAVAAALAAQQALVAERWPAGVELRARMGLHTGEAHVRNDRSYFGHTLDRATRIRAVGHGGQVLVSAATATLVADRVPADASLEDLGFHRLNDLGRPEHVWQVIHPELPATFPALRSLDTFRHNLPVQLTPLIGRDADVVEVGGLLEHERLVTLTGSAGVGKTRLALAAAADTIGEYPGGVWFVELAPVTDPGAVGRAALAVLGAREAPGVSAVDQLAVALGEEPSLLVLDNCEHLIASCAELVAELLAANPTASVLATSREPLGVPGEITWRVPSLRCPERERPVEIPSLSQYDAVVLFVERAHRARPSFAVNDANAPAIAEICHRLDGIPLAIELAAARCRQMSAERIATELDDRFRLLTGGARTVLPRQQTLAASVDWSHFLLDDAEQTTFRRLGVFAGSFPLEAAEHVVPAIGGIERDEVFDLISRLVDKNLVVADEGRGGEPRYRLLESLRAYAVDRARSAGELETCREAHARWWAEWLEPRADMPTDEVVEEIAEVHTNLKAALDWSADRPELGLRLLGGVARAWDELGRAGDAMLAADRLLAEANVEIDADRWLSVAWRTCELVLAARGNAEQLALIERIEAVAGQHGNEFYRRLARWPQNEMAVKDPAWRQLATEHGDPYFDAWVPLLRACFLAEDEPVAAVAVLAEARAAGSASGVRSLRAMVGLAEADLACSTGDLATAIQIATDFLQRPDNSSWWRDFLRIAGFAALLSEDEDALCAALDAAELALRITPGQRRWVETAQHRLELLRGHPSGASLAHGHPPPTCSTLWTVTREAIDAGAADEALAFARSQAWPAPHPRAVVAAIEGAATGDEDRWHEALAIALEQGFRLIAVDALEGLAVAAARVESWWECLRLIGAAGRLRDETGYRWRFGCEQRAVDAASSAAGEALGDEAATAEADGRHLDWREAAAYARRARGERKRPSHGWASLTPTEQQVVALVADGLTNPQIAERLFIGRSTVKTHLEHIFTKLGLHTRAELAAQAARRASGTGRGDPAPRP
jgi:predicted ATPase/class 3 adenylate cyclase/DNA-binding CsgD family transcriptional regulator